MSINLLIYSPLSLRFGAGFEHWILETSYRLLKRGFNIIIVTTKSTYTQRSTKIPPIFNEAKKDPKFEYYEIDFKQIPFFKSPIPRVDQLFKFAYANLCKKNSVDILYFNNAFFLNDLITILFSKFINVPVILGQHACLFQKNVLHTFYSLISRKMLWNFFSAFHVLNRYYYKLFKSLVPYKWKSKVYLIPPGVDKNKYFINQNDDTFKITFVGRLSYQKGIDILPIIIYKFEKLITRNSLPYKYEFNIVGIGPMKNIVRKISKKKATVYYLGYLSEKDLINLLSESSLFIFPSRYETFGIAVLEAQASGLPVISFNISGPNDIIVNGVTGRLVNTFDTDKFALSIFNYYKKWIDNPNWYINIRKKIRKITIKRFDWNLIIEKMVRMFSEVLSTY